MKNTVEAAIEAESMIDTLSYDLAKFAPNGFSKLRNVLKEITVELEAKGIYGEWSSRTTSANVL